MQPRSDAMDHTVYVGVGANLGARIHALAHARRCLLRMGERVECSPVYETSPVGFADQPDFLNMVVRLQTPLSPLDFLKELQRAEAEYGRVRTIRDGPRTLDLDVLLYGNEYICFQSLQIPHPRMWGRGFVLAPLAHLAPDMQAPGGRRVLDLAKDFCAKGDVRYVGRFW